jgi:hypothetical protein
MAPRWTQQELDDLARLYADGSVSRSSLKEHFNRSIGTIKQRARDLGIRRVAAGLWTPEEIADLKRLYIDEDIPREQIMAHFGRTWRSITGMANRLGLRRPHPNTRNVIRDYFRNIDSNEKAYWLGFLAADGAIYHNGRQYSVILDLQPRDRHWLERFRDTIAPGSTISQHGERSFSVCIGSKEMVHDLISLGVGLRKSNTLEWPNVPEDLVMPFLLGYFDGDGSLQKRPQRDGYLWTLIGTYAFLSVARDYIQQCAGVLTREPVRHSNNRCPHLYRIHAYSQNAATLDRALNASGLGLPRKHLPPE